jgi:hypothetical protein
VLYLVNSSNSMSIVEYCQSIIFIILKFDSEIKKKLNYQVNS